MIVIKIGITTNYINSSADRGLTGNDNAGVTYGIALSSTPGFAELHPDANGIYPEINLQDPILLKQEIK
jgi:hypothetical protein